MLAHTPNEKKPLRKRIGRLVRTLTGTGLTPEQRKQKEERRRLEKEVAEDHLHRTSHYELLKQIHDNLPDSVRNKEAHQEAFRDAVHGHPLLNSAKHKEEHKQRLEHVNRHLPGHVDNHMEHRASMQNVLREIEAVESTSMLEFVAAGVFVVAAGAGVSLLLSML
jgi:hypothetical protein